MTKQTFTYAVGDIHGRIDVLELIIQSVERDRKKRGDLTGEKTKLVFLGDYIDRGPMNRHVVGRLMEGSRDKTRWVMLRGNHEEMAIMAHADRSRYWRWWCENGGLATAMSFEGEVPETVLKWFAGLPTRHTDRFRYFVHAGVNPDYGIQFQDEEVRLWVRHKQDEETPFERYVVHGHTPFIAGPVMLESRINLDVQTYATGRAAIAVFDDNKPGQPIDVLEVRAGYVFNA